jgi:F0F1-type ATP synthase membrane subunit b/b'
MGIIIYILNRFLFRPYLKFIKEEDKKRVELDTAYEEMNVLKEKAKLEAGQIVESAKVNALEIRANIENLANQEKEAIIAKAEAE